MKLSLLLILSVILLSLTFVTAESPTSTTINSSKVDLGKFTLETPDFSDVTWQVDKDSYTPILKPEYYKLDSKTGKQVLIPLPSITFNVNKLEETSCVTSNQFYSECTTKKWDFSKFEAKNSVVKTITPITNSWLHCSLQEFPFVWQINDCMNIPISYDITYTGSITDLDPSFQTTLSTSSFGYFNQTMANNTGVSLIFNGTSQTGYNNTRGDYISGVHYNDTLSTGWRLSLGIADTYSTKTNLTLSTGTGINLSNPNLIAYYPLDNFYFKDAFSDAKALNNGTCSGTGCSTNVTGLSSNAMQFDGGANCIKATPSTFLNNNITIYAFSRWIRPAGVRTPATGVHPIFSNENYSSSSPGALIIGQATSLCSNEIIYLASESSGVTSYRTCYYSPSTIDNNWHHVAFTWNGSQYEIYLDNSRLTGSSPGGATGGHARLFNFTGIYIGSWLLYNTNWSGSLDEMSFFNKSLNQQEINQLYKSGLSQHANTNITIQMRTADSYNVSDEGLVGLWAFNNATGENGTFFKNEKESRYNGTCATCPDFVANGVVGGAMNFSVRTYISLPGTSDIRNQTVGTVTAWVKTANNTMRHGVSAIFATAKAAAASPFYMLTTAGFYTVDSAVNYQQLKALGEDSPLNDTNWHFLSWSGNLSTLKFYIDGENKTLTASAGVNGGEWFNDTYSDTVSIGAMDRDTDYAYFNGSIDEFRMYNRTLTDAEILNLYNLGNVHINGFNTWSTENVTQDGKAQTGTTAGKFMQFKANFYTNNSRSSPYLLNYSILNGDTAPPTITWLSQYPTDISTTNLFNNNLTINYTVRDGVAVKDNTTELFFKTNSSTRDFSVFLNGSAGLIGWKSSLYSQGRVRVPAENNSDNYTWWVNPNLVYPMTINLRNVDFEDNVPVIISLTSKNHWASTKFSNGTLDPVNYIEVMLNSTPGASSAELYYCNSSWSETSLTDTSCFNFANQPAIQDFNHTHTINSKHQVYSVTGVGTLFGVTYRTANFTIVVRGSNVGTWYVYNSPVISKTGDTKTTTNGGTTWANYAGTINSHVHQYNGTTFTMYYYACANDTSNNRACSTVSSDLLGLGNMPPSAVFFNLPQNESYEKSDAFEINHTISYSPNNYAIIQYNRSLEWYNESFYIALNTSDNNTLNFTYDVLAFPTGQFRIRLEIFDQNNLTTHDHSRAFYLSDDITKPNCTLYTPTNSTTSSFYNSSNVSLKLTCIDNVALGTCIYTLDGGANTTFTPNSTIYHIGFNAWHNLLAGCYDTSGNFGWASSLFFVSSEYLYNQTCTTCGNTFNQTYASYNTTSSGSTVTTCKYKKFGYYNEKLPWLRSGDCL